MKEKSVVVRVHPEFKKLIDANAAFSRLGKIKYTEEVAKRHKLPGGLIDIDFKF